MTLLAWWSFGNSERDSDALRSNGLDGQLLRFMLDNDAGEQPGFWDPAVTTSGVTPQRPGLELLFPDSQTIGGNTDAGALILAQDQPGPIPDADDFLAYMDMTNLVGVNNPSVIPVDAWGAAFEDDTRSENQPYYGTYPGRGALVVEGLANNGQYFDIVADLTGFEDIDLSFLAQTSNVFEGGYTSIAVSASSDGGASFTPVVTFPEFDDFNPERAEVDFGTLLDNASNAVIRFTLDGATTTGSAPGTLFDSFQLHAGPDDILDSIAVNEILPDATGGDDLDGNGIVDFRDEFVEYLNTGTVPIDIGGLGFKANNLPFYIPSNTILEPGGRLLLLNGEGGAGTTLPTLPQGSHAFFAGDNGFDSFFNAFGNVYLFSPESSSYIEAYWGTTTADAPTFFGGDFTVAHRPAEDFGAVTPGVSLARAPDGTGAPVPHTSIGDGTIAATPGEPNTAPSANPLQDIVFNEILVDPDDGAGPGGLSFDTNGDGTLDNRDDQFLELYNPTASAIDASDWQFWDRFSGKYFTVPDGTSIAPGGFLLLIRDAGNGSVPAVEGGSHAFEFPNAAANETVFNPAGDNIVVYDPDLDAFIQAVYNGASIDNPPSQYSDFFTGEDFSDTATRLPTPGAGAVQDLGNDVDGTSLALDPDGDTSSPVAHTQIGDGSVLATPGTSNVAPEPTPFGDIVVNEILVDPDDNQGPGGRSFDTNGDGISDFFDAFVELYNTGTTAVDASGWQFWNDGQGLYFDVPAGTTLAPGEFLTLVREERPGGSLPNPGTAVFPIGPDGTTITVFDPVADNVVVYDPASDSFIQALYNGDAADTPAADYAGFSATATRIGPVQDLGQDADGTSIALLPDGKAGLPLLHDAIGDGSVPASPAASNTAPGALPPPLESLVVNEILPDPRFGATGSVGIDTNGDGTTDFDDTFLELVNTSDQVIDIGGLEFWDTSNDVNKYFTVPDETFLAPGGFLTLVRGAGGGALPAAEPGSHVFELTDITTQIVWGIFETGDDIIVYDPDTDTYTQTVYNGTPLPGNTLLNSLENFPSDFATRVGPALELGDDQPGVSLALSPDGETTNPVLHDAIGDGSVLSTPGAPNVAPSVDPLTGLVINELLVEPRETGAGGFDTNGDGSRSFDDAFIELYNTSGGALDLSGLEFWSPNTFVGNYFTVPGGTVLAPGEFLAVVANDNGAVLPDPANGVLFGSEHDAGGPLFAPNGSNVYVYNPTSETYLHAVYNGAAANAPNTIAGIAAGATRIGDVQNLGNDLDGASLALLPDGETGISVPHSQIGGGTVNASPAASNTAPTGTVLENIAFNEILRVASGPVLGFDTDEDGIVEASDEFVEFRNTSSDAQDIGGLELWVPGEGKIFTVPADTVLAPGAVFAIVTDATAATLPDVGDNYIFSADAGDVSLLNDFGGVVVLHDPAEDTFIQATYFGQTAVAFTSALFPGLPAAAAPIRIGEVEDFGLGVTGVSLAAIPDGSGDKVPHTAIGDGSVFATPGAANTAPEPTDSPLSSIVINEVLVDPADRSSPGGPEFDTNGDGIVNRFDSFIELHNTGATAVDAGGWQFWDGQDEGAYFTVPAGTEIAPGGYLVLVREERAFAGGELPDVEPGSFAFAQGPDGTTPLVLSEADNIVIYDPGSDTFIQAVYNGDNIDSPQTQGDGDGFFTFPLNATRAAPLQDLGQDADGISIALAPDGDIGNPVLHNTLGDGTLNASPGVRNVGPNLPPVAQDDAISATEDEPVAFDVRADNGNGPDTDPDDDPLTPVILAQPGRGTVTANADGTFTYDADDEAFDLADPGEVFVETFTYRIEDGNGGSDTGEVTITVTTQDDGVKIVGDFDDRNDIIGSDGGEDVLIGGAEEDEIYGRDGADTLDGGSDEDELFGGEGPDKLFGGGDEDILRGGPGDDELTGGGDDDIFVLVPGEGTDTITDFDPRDDEIGLQGLTTGDIAVGDIFGDVHIFGPGGERLAIVLDASTDDFGPEAFVQIDTGTGEPDGGQRLIVEDDVDKDGNLLVAIVGTPQRDAELFADVSGLYDPTEEDPGAVEFMWLRNGIPIEDADEQTYVPGEDDVLSELSVRVDYVRGDGALRILATSAEVAIAGLPQTITGTDGDDVLAGGPGNDTVDALPGDDVIRGGEFDDTIDGGTGLDVAEYSGGPDSYTVTFGGPGGVQVEDRRGPLLDGTDLLQDVELIRFDQAAGGEGDAPATFVAPPEIDLRILSDAEDIPAEALTELVQTYIAFYGRAPDAEGLLFWAAARAQGLSLDEIGAHFAAAPEMAERYPSDLPVGDFVQKVYDNVLGRGADDAGLVFWTGVIESGAVTRDAFILRLLEGVAAPAPEEADPAFIAQKEADRAYLEAQTDVGTYFAVTKGLPGTDDAADVMALVDGTPEGLAAARDAIEDLWEAALDPEEGALLLPLVGVLEDPFLV